MSNLKGDNSIDFLIGKALNEESFRVSIKNYLKTIACPNEMYYRIIECLSGETFIFSDLMQHGKAVTAFAMEMANNYAKQKLVLEKTARPK